MAASYVRAALGHVWATLAPTNCRCALMGGLSLSFWKHVRNTQDVDILIDAGPIGIDAILNLLGQAGVRTKRHPAILDLDSVRIIQLLYEPKDAFTDIQIDLLLAESPFHLEALNRRISVRLPDIDLDLYTLSCEDVLILKILAGRIIDRADAAALVRLNRTELDLPYLLRWVTHFNLQPELGEIWREALPGEPLPG